MIGGSKNAPVTTVPNKTIPLINTKKSLINIVLF